MFMSPNSFTKTATFKSLLLLRIWFNSVVFPLPKNPVMMVTGIPRLRVNSDSSGIEAVMDIPHTREVNKRLDLQCFTVKMVGQ